MLVLYWSSRWSSTPFVATSRLQIMVGFIYNFFYSIQFNVDSKDSFLSESSMWLKKRCHIEPSINNVGIFFRFLTPPSPMMAFFSTICWQFWPIFDPFPQTIADVVYGQLLSLSWSESVDELFTVIGKTFKFSA